MPGRAFFVGRIGPFDSPAPQRDDLPSPHAQRGVVGQVAERLKAPVC